MSKLLVRCRRFGVILLSIFLVIVGASPSIVFADELILPEGELLLQGYQPVEPISFLALDSSEWQQSLPLEWPVKFEDARHSMGNNFIQFQNYGQTNSYFHGGCDLRSDNGANVVAPASGRLEAGHYGYSTNKDGSMTKHWKAWPETGSALYFEVAVVTKDGYRFELHHLDRSSLPSSIVDKLNSAEPTVEAGELVGKVVRWPVRGGADRSYYHHVHYNIVEPSGAHLNPEWYSQKILDTMAPALLTMFSVNARGEITELKGNQLPTDSEEVIVEVEDRKDNNVYAQMVPFVEMEADGVRVAGWDFRQKLVDDNGLFPELGRVFQERFTSKDGRRRRTQGDYGGNRFYVRLTHGAIEASFFKISLRDQVGNITVIQGEIAD